MTKEMPKAYEPGEYEDDIYKEWEESGFFCPENLKDTDGVYCNIMPPPNANGELHIGHVSGYAVMDLVGRYQRMLGKKTLLLPGKDHAGIQTQVVYEKKIKQERNQSRYDVGREKFYSEVYDFCINRSEYMRNQERKIGMSADWSREKFTLDPSIIKQVLETFVKMYHEVDAKGNRMAYRGDRIINWCPRCASALADVEVEHEEKPAKLYYFKYDKDFPVTIATTRPETKLGDTAVAVNPEDSRYQDLIGGEFGVDFVGIPLKIKIIADRGVEMDFGAGALGVTPGHSAIDWRMAQENDLPIIKVIDENGRIREGFSEFSGKSVLEARARVVEILKERGLLEKEEEIVNNLSVCERCKTAIEPLVSKQWFIDVDHDNFSLKKEARKAVESGALKIYPERFRDIMLSWIDNVHDWCVSRQIWWGPQIPAWYREKKLAKSVDFCFLRHGQTDWNVKGIMQGSAETELNETGRKQAEAKEKLFSDFNPDIIISSPMKRALETVKIANKNNYPVITDDRLKERNYGKIEGMHKDDIMKQYPGLEVFTKNNLPYLIECPGGEKYEEVYARVEDFLKEVVEKYQGKKVLVMSHGDTLDMVEAIMQKASWRAGVGTWFDNTREVLVSFGIDEGGAITVSGEKEVYVGNEAPDGDWTRDPDTFDTWFSSGQWAYTTLGFPNGKDFKEYYPSDTMIMGRDILPFWAFRMLILSLYRTGKIPFKNLYFTGLIRDIEGKKMSKSKGNGIEPLEMIEKYGTDAVRLSLLIGSTPGNDMNLGEEKIMGFRNLVNKLWNVARYSITNYELRITNYEFDFENLTLADKMIVAKMKNLIKSVSDDIEDYRFSAAGESLREFTWDDLADWYIEASKFDDRESKNIVFGRILPDLLKLWHPFIPFVTETIWKEFGVDGKLIVARWPQAAEYDIFATKQEDIDNFEIVKNIITSVRNARSENKVEPARKVKTLIFAGDKIELIKGNEALIRGMRTGISELELSSDASELSSNSLSDAIKVVSDEIIIYLLGAVDKEKEARRIEKEKINLEKQIKILNEKLENQKFIQRAPEKIVKIERERLATLEKELEALANYNS